METLEGVIEEIKANQERQIVEKLKEKFEISSLPEGPAETQEDKAKRLERENKLKTLEGVIDEFKKRTQSEMTQALEELKTQSEGKITTLTTELEKANKFKTEVTQSLSAGMPPSASGSSSPIETLKEKLETLTKTQTELTQAQDELSKTKIELSKATTSRDELSAKISGLEAFESQVKKLVWSDVPPSASGTLIAELEKLLKEGTSTKETLATTQA